MRSQDGEPFLTACQFSQGLLGRSDRDEQRGFDSDVNLLVVLEDGVDRAEYERRVRGLAYDVELERVLVSLQVLPESGYQRGTPFLRQVQGGAEQFHG